MWDATSGQVQTKVLNTVLQREGGREKERDAKSKRHRAGPGEAASERNKARVVSGERPVALGLDVVSRMAVVSEDAHLPREPSSELLV